MAVLDIVSNVYLDILSGQSSIFTVSVGTEPHRREDRSAGVATTGVALQGPAQVAVCKDTRKQCARDVCKGGSVQALST